MVEPSLLCMMYWNRFRCSRACSISPGLLIGARQAKFCRSVQWVQLEGMLESINGLWKLLHLNVDGTQHVPGVGVVAVYVCDILKIIDGSLRFTRILIEKTEVVPGVRV